MKIRAWRTIGKNPCENPPVSISIGSAGRSGNPEYFFPWVLSLENARAIFGEIVDQITETPAIMKLNMIQDEGGGLGPA